MSLSLLVTGSLGLNDIAGPVGIVSQMNTIGQETAQTHGYGAAIINMLFITSLIMVNVAVINLLPIPAMDGGRILFIFITLIIEKISGKKLDPKYEAYINTVTFILLIGLMIFILFNDVIREFFR